jgi:hypothetical protein
MFIRVLTSALFHPRSYYRVLTTAFLQSRYYS